jgi:hypothetical protein
MRYINNFRTYYFIGRLISNNNIKMDLAEVGYEDTNFTEAAQDNK